MDNKKLLLFPGTKDFLLETEQLKLRLWEYEDIDDLYEITSDGHLMIEKVKYFRKPIIKTTKELILSSINKENIKFNSRSFEETREILDGFITSNSSTDKYEVAIFHKEIKKVIGGVTFEHIENNNYHLDFIFNKNHFDQSLLIESISILFNFFLSYKEDMLISSKCFKKNTDDRLIASKCGLNYINSVYDSDLDKDYLLYTALFKFCPICKAQLIEGEISSGRYTSRWSAKESKNLSSSSIILHNKENCGNLQSFFCSFCNIVITDVKDVDFR